MKYALSVARYRKFDEINIRRGIIPATVVKAVRSKLLLTDQCVFRHVVSRQNVNGNCGRYNNRRQTSGQIKARDASASLGSSCLWNAFKAADGTFRRKFVTRKLIENVFANFVQFFLSISHRHNHLMIIKPY